MMQMGPLRTAWTFPYTGEELIQTCNDLEAKLVAQLDESLTAEEDYETELAEYRERLREAGVASWATAKLDPQKGHFSSMESAFRSRQKDRAKKLDEVRRYRRQLEHDLTRQPDRTFKLSVDDVTFFDL